MSNINLIVFGTFGNPNGFKQTFFEGIDRDLAKAISTFDLNTNAIKLFPGSSIYSIRKEFANGLNIISYSQYSFAKEKNSERSGTFIGSSVLFTNKISEEAIIISILNEFQETLTNRYVVKDVITVNHSDELRVGKPKDLDQVNLNLKELSGVNFSKKSNKNLVVYCNTAPSQLEGLFNKSLDLLNIYDTIYFSQSHEVAEYVARKGIFKLDQVDDFNKEITNLIEERKTKIQNSLNQFENEIIRLNDDRNQMILDFQSQKEKNIALHKENEQRINEAEADFSRLDQNYKDFGEKIKELINQLKSGRNYNEVKWLLDENRNLFIDSVNELKRPNFINKIPKIKGTTKFGRSDNSYPEDFQRRDSYKVSVRKGTLSPKGAEDESSAVYDIDYVKLGAFIAIVAIILVMFWFLLKIDFQST